MNEKTIQLGNTIWWDRCEDDKVYMDKLRIILPGFPFATRQVCLRFDAGPELDLSLFDMDRIAVEYLGMPASSCHLKSRTSETQNRLHNATSWFLRIS